MRKYLNSRIVNILLLTGDLGLLYGSLFLTLWVRGGWPLLNRLWWQHLLSFSILYVAWLAILYVHDLYHPLRRRLDAVFFQHLAQAMVLNALLAAAFFYSLRSLGIMPRANLILHLAIFTGLFVIWRWVAARSFAGRPGRRGVLFFEPDERLLPFIMRLAGDGTADHRLLGFVPAAGSRLDLSGRMPSYDGAEGLVPLARRLGADTVVVGDAVSGSRHPGLFELSLAGVTVIDAGAFWEEIYREVPVDLVDIASFTGRPGDVRLRGFEVTKRMFDAVFAVVAAVVFSGPMLLIAAVIRLTGRGPVIYAQQRVGFMERTFTLYKFRTMTAAQDASGSQWAVKDDPRVTPVGRILRHTHLDELPQLWNILRGEMSFVGPRPEQPQFVEMLKKEVPGYVLRHLVKPGITGWAQINFRYGSSVADAARKLSLDLYYVRHRSHPLDARILVRTVAMFVLGEGR